MHLLELFYDSYCGAELRQCMERMRFVTLLYHTREPPELMNLHGDGGYIYFSDIMGKI